MRVLALAVSIAAAPYGADAQQVAQVSRIGFLSPSSSADAGRLAAFRQGLRDLGYVEGQNVAIESRWADGAYDRLPDLAVELVRLKVDVIVTYAAPAILAVRRATATIPIVMAGAGDPLGSGLVTSIARPGGNITGLSVVAPELVGKQLEILREVIPRVSRVAVLGNPANASHTSQVEQAQDAARVLGLRIQPVEARGAEEIGSAFATMIRERIGAVVVLVDAMLIDFRAHIAGLAAKNRLPAMYALRDHAEVGGLMAYGPSVRDRFRRAATYVDKILRGAKPADLPVEQPTKFELVVNLKTARALGLAIPESVLIRADEVIR